MGGAPTRLYAGGSPTHPGRVLDECPICGICPDAYGAGEANPSYIAEGQGEGAEEEGA
jgi:hypothetical protein